MRSLPPLDWNGVDLVVFDVDGTLYRQNRLRALITYDLLLDAASRLSLEAMRIIRCYRRIREQLAVREVLGFDDILVAETAARTRHSTCEVRAVVEEWIERRPLPYLAACRYPRLVELFAALRRSGKAIGILSDYPAAAKLAALGLDADHVICANDKAIGLLKPNPRGLQSILEEAAVSPQRTVVIGDRVDRDGAVAARIGARALIRSARLIKGWQTFARFDDPLFECLLGRNDTPVAETASTSRCDRRDRVGWG
jgi:FMN phosphatase YigB (HAD superfamily)